MKRVIAVTSILAATVVSAGDISLPQPVTHGGKSLMQALSERKTSRDFSVQELSAQTLSSLLWAANGINRPDGRRTAPTGLNVQDTDVYVMLASGVYRYDAKSNVLVLVNPGDHRTSAGKQPFSHTAPVNLFYVHDRTRGMKADEANTQRYAGIHAGAIMQNVYLFCAKEGLATVARANLDYDACAKALKLNPDQRVVLGQSVGYPPVDGYVGRQAAIRAALAHAKFNEADVRKLRCELDREDGVMVYEVDFKKDGFEYDYDIDARTGTVIKAKKERD
jgi:SagB-type dehydrogenase family enzyme